MRFKPAIWHPIAVGLSAINLGAVWFAAQPGEPWHATIHAALAVAFGVWAQRLRQGPRPSEHQARLEAVEDEVNALQQELGEAHERLDFAERMLAQRPDPHRVSPEG